MSFLWMKVKRSKKQKEKEFSMLLFMYSKVMEINYTTAISKKGIADKLSSLHIFGKSSMQWKDWCAEKSFL